MSVRIVTDTSCDLPPDLERELLASGVQMIPFLFHFDQEACPDKSMSMREFIERANKVWPTTAAPSVGAFVQAFRRVVEAGHQVLCLTITGRHSATYSTAVLAAQEFEPGEVTVLDSNALSMAQGLIVLAASRAAQAGATVQEVVARVEDVRRRLELYFTLESVDYLVRGGRASRLVGALASLLRLRPIITLVDGELTLIEKPRSRAGSVARLMALARALLPAETIGVMHIDCPDEADQLAAEMSAMSGLPRDHILVTETGMALAAHGGPGTLGVVVVSQA
jgi:DegV family protein with EDD domain